MQDEAEKQSGLLNQMPQYNFNLIKSEPADRLSPFGGPIAPSVSPTMFQVQNSNVPTNMGTLRPIHSPGRTPSPMECALYNLPPAQQQQQNMASQLQPIIIPHGSPSPILMQDPMIANRPVKDLNTSFQLGDTSAISNAIGNSINLGILDDTTQQTADFDLNFSQFDNVDLTSLNISDVIKEAVNGEDTGVTAEESGMTDSFTTLTRKTMQELRTLNNMYQPTRDNVN